MKTRNPTRRGSTTIAASPLARAAVLILAVAGLGLIVDALAGSPLPRYRLAGLLLGACLLLPAFVSMTMGARGRWLLRRCAFALAPVSLLVGCLEPALRLAGIGADAAVVVVADTRLGHVLQPGCGEADANGFRNPSVPARADVVFVGDSQVYGFGLPRAQSLPFVYGQRASADVYSMSLGGYGAVQYRELVRQALQLQPRAIVVGFYFGNDLVDAYLHAQLPCAEDLRRGGVDYPLHSAVEGRDRQRPNLAVAALDTLASSSRLVTVGMAVLRQRMSGVSAVWADEPGSPSWRSGAIATLFTPRYRHRAVDQRDLGVLEGTRITMQCLRDIGRDCARAGVRCVLVPIHTKEYCFRELELRQGLEAGGSAQLAALHDDESQARGMVLNAAVRAGIEVADPTPQLVAALELDRPMWPNSADGHLNAGGHAVLAEMLVRVLGSP